MKIDNVSHLPTPSRVDQGKGQGKVSGTSANAGAGASAALQFSHPAGDASQDINPARVAEVRQAIAEGRLKMDTGRIADRLIASARDLVGGAQ